jgi:transcriptional regulator with XRE-family HTH domain
MDIKQVGLLIRQKRRDVMLTQQQLAQQAGLSRATVASLESGALSEIGFTKLQRLLEAVGLELRVAQAPTDRPTMDELMAINQQEYEQSHARKARFRT